MDEQKLVEEARAFATEAKNPADYFQVMADFAAKMVDDERRRIAADLSKIDHYHVGFPVGKLICETCKLIQKLEASE